MKEQNFLVKSFTGRTSWCWPKARWESKLATEPVDRKPIQGRSAGDRAPRGDVETAEYSKSARFFRCTRDQLGDLQVPRSLDIGLEVDVLEIHILRPQ